MEKLSSQSWSRVELAPSHAYLLMAVLEEPGMQPGILADHLQLQPSTITRLIEKLEEKKLVVRTTEGKITNVYPTPKARELQPRMNTCMEEFLKNVSELIGKEESLSLVRQMAKVADKLTD
jgi:DNA-binding MarR family transcriptional regulator